MPVPYRLGIDIGVNSLGWCALRLDDNGRPASISDAGVRLFSDGRDPKTGTSLAVDRRNARSMRRRRDRYLLRRKDLMAALVHHGLMPTDEAARKALESLDPYELRAKGLDNALPLHHFGRAIFHLHQRRGFKSNRKTDKPKNDKKDDKGKIKAAATKLTTAMAESGARTLGEFLWRRHEKRQAVRVRLAGEGAKAEYDFYPQRAMLEAEFDALWAKQAAFHSDLTDRAREAIRKIAFRQRPLRPVDPGKCTLEPTDRRAPEALPVAQDFRIRQEIANIRVEDDRDGTRRPLSPEQCRRLYDTLERKAKMTFGAIRKLLKLPTGSRINLEDEKRAELKGHVTNAILSDESRFGKAWWDFDEAKRTAIVETLVAEPDESAILEIARTEWDLDEEAAEAVADAPLPDGYARLGRIALGKIVPIMATGEKDYAAAVREVYPHHSDFRTGEIFDALPYYGQALERHVAWGTGDPDDTDERRFGRIANPTVHIGLNQLRKLINVLIAAHGHPDQIVVELARELKLGAERKKQIQKDQAENQKKNEIRRKKLAELAAEGCGCDPESGRDLRLLRLWEELAPEPHDRRCIYTGEVMSPSMLFTSAVDVDHIIPFRLCLDDGMANKIVCLAEANKRKKKQTPFDAFGHTPEWPDILARAQSLPPNKRWRFQPDALERLKPEGREGLPAEALTDMELGSGFLARHLTDTQYLARATREYLGNVCNPNKVWVIPGRLTAMLRAKWGLNTILSDDNVKNRADHRHHAVDAAVVALTDRAMLQQIASANENSRERLIDDMPDPWPEFRDELRDRLRATVVSVRPNHGTGGRLHEDTAYGLVRDPAAEDGHNLVFRKAFLSLNENEVARIRDPQLRAALTTHIESVKDGSDGKLSAAAMKQAVADFAAAQADGPYKGIRHVRLLKVEQDVIGIEDRRSGQPYKALVPGENHRIDIYQQPDGTWVAEAITVFEANRPTPPPRRKAHPAARKVMSLHKGDFLKLEHEGLERIMRIHRLSPSNNVLYLADHEEGGDLQARHTDKDDPFRWLFANIGQLKNRAARKVTVDVLGRVRDPGPPK